MMPKKEPIILIGGGGHCKACIDVIEQEGRFFIAGIVDIQEKLGESILGYKYIGTDEDIPELVRKYKNALITVGQIKSAKLRIKLYELLKKAKATLPVITSPLAYVSKSATINEGTIIMHDVVVNAESKIGVNCILNSKCLIEHEAIVGNNCHISTGAIINGQVKVGEECFIGSGSVIGNNISIIDGVIVPAGMPVYNDIKRKGIYIKRH
jgi:sugar O-acyltransferase (sialic acid O-acetyltransferase NeuD family)